jgi:hypothetical protein
LNPKPLGKYSRFTAKNAVSEPIKAIKDAANPTLAINKLNDIKLPITTKKVTKIRRISAATLLVLSRFSTGNQVRKSAIGPLNKETDRIIATRSASDSMVKG